MKDPEKIFRLKNKNLKATKCSGKVYNDADFRLGDDWLIEAKNHPSKNSISVSNSIWKKIKKQAIMRNRKPLIMFTNMVANVVIMDENDFKELYDKVYKE